MAGTNLRNGQRSVLALLLALLIAMPPVLATAEDGQVSDDDGMVASQPIETTPDEGPLEVEKLPEGTDDPVQADDAEVDATLEGEVDNGEETEPQEEDVEEPTLEEAAGPELPEAPSGAQTVAPGTYVLQWTITGDRLIETTAKTPQALGALHTATYAGSNNQKWIVERIDDTCWYRLRSAANNSLALGVVGIPVVNDVPVMLDVDSNEAVSTLWAFVANSDGTTRLVNAANPELAISVKDAKKDAGTSLILTAASGGKSQRMRLVDAKPSVPAGKTGLEGAYFISDKASSLVAEVVDGKTTNNANVALATKDSADNQKIYLEPVDGGGYYVAWVIGTRKVLRVNDGNILPGSNVSQYKYSGKDSQKWAVREVSGGYVLVNKATGLSLAADGSKAGANLMGATSGSTLTFKRVALLKSGIVEIKPRSESSVVLTVSGGSTKSGAKVVLGRDKNVLHQRYQLISAGGTDLWRIRTASSGGYLTAKSGVISQEGKGSTPQSSENTWRVTFRGGWYGLLLNDGSNVALNLPDGKTTRGTRVNAAESNGSDAQHFTFEAAMLVRTGNHFIRNIKGKYLDVAGNSTSSGANVQTYKKQANRLLGLQFTIEKSGSYVRLKNTYSGNYVTCTGTGHGSNVVMKPSSSSKAQKWQPVIVDGGYVAFRGVGAYKNNALQVSKGSSKNGANVLVGVFKGGKSQKWKPGKATYTYDPYIKRAVKRANESYSSTPYFIVVDRDNTHVVILKGGNGNWQLYRTYICSVGKPSTPTITGSYTVGSRGYSFSGGDHTCYYWTQISGDYLFHSVLYQIGTMNILDGRLGMHVSLGCVRLDISIAKWIYDNIPSGTKVLIY